MSSTFVCGDLLPATCVSKQPRPVVDSRPEVRIAEPCATSSTVVFYHARRYPVTSPRTRRSLQLASYLVAIAPGTSFHRSHPPSLPPTAMDYSATINDADDAVGASPWGNSPASSPKNARTSLGHVGDEPPPLRFHPHGSNGFSEDPHAPEGFQRPGTATTSSGTEGETEPSTTQESSQGEQSGDAQPVEPVNTAEAAAPSGPSDQSAQNEEPRRPAKPQHKLQAKVTGLERTGKKDPIIRFDVHVCLPWLHLQR